MGMTPIKSEMIDAWFAGGGLHLQHIRCDVEQHIWHALKKDGGAEYYRVTIGTQPPHLISLFVARGLEPEEQRRCMEEAGLHALQQIIKGAK